MSQELLEQALAALRALPGVEERLDGLSLASNPVEVALKAVQHDSAVRQKALADSVEATLKPLVNKSVRVHFTSAKPAGGQGEAPLYDRQAVKGVKKIVAVASAKGGVGKSTLAANLALAIHFLGKRAGLADLDLFGPSAHLLLGAKTKPQADANGQLIPPSAHGLALMTSGILVERDQPLVMRGPMVQKTLLQLLHGVAWPDLDVLVLDLPPGTGDVPLSLAQKVKVDGALIVSTPQDLALNDVRRGLSMFAKVDLPVLGLVENMAHFTCSHCGTTHRIFGEGGVAQTAADLGLPLLASLPLDPQVQSASDSGEPVLVQAPHGATSKAFLDLGARVLAALT